MAKAKHAEAEVPEEGAPEVEAQEKEPEAPKEPEKEVAPPDTPVPATKTIVPPRWLTLHAALKFLAARCLAAPDLKGFRESFPEVWGE